jgi:hypothetical protein
VEADLDAWMTRLAGGDRSAFDPIYSALRPRARALAAARLRSPIADAFVPPGLSPWRVVFGMTLGVASIAIRRCSTLFFGESVGLLGGLLAGIVARSLARGVLSRASTR